MSRAATGAQMPHAHRRHAGKPRQDGGSGGGSSPRAAAPADALTSASTSVAGGRAEPSGTATQHGRQGAQVTEVAAGDRQQSPTRPARAQDRSRSGSASSRGLHRAATMHVAPHSRQATPPAEGRGKGRGGDGVSGDRHGTESPRVRRLRLGGRRHRQHEPEPRRFYSSNDINALRHNGSERLQRLGMELKTRVAMQAVVSAYPGMVWTDRTRAQHQAAAAFPSFHANHAPQAVAAMFEAQLEEQLDKLARQRKHHSGGADEQQRLPGVAAPLRGVAAPGRAFYGHDQAPSYIPVLPAHGGAYAPRGHHQQQHGASFVQGWHQAGAYGPRHGSFQRLSTVGEERSSHRRGRDARHGEGRRRHDERARHGHSYHSEHQQPRRHHEEAYYVK